jgi:poly(beta-D-mannuronate) C5 epimerase
MKKMGHKRTLIVAATMMLLVGAAAKTALFPVPSFTLLSAVIDAAATTSDDCVDYHSSERIIVITCDSTFEQLEEDINDISVLEELGNGEYLLSANIEVADQVRLTIASPAVTWVKISNEGGDSSQYYILVNGYMDIEGVKVTSWDPDRDSVVEQDSKGSVPRPYIVYEAAEGGIIENSELAYIGYDGNIRRGFSLTHESANIEIKNSDFHHFWYAFYSNGARNVTIDGSKFHDNHKYAIDPHTGTHDMSITNNLVYNNPGSGIICSLDCHNILIENNTVHDNGKNGINFSRNMHDSIVRSNTIYNSDKGIRITESPNNEVYSNTIYNVSDGFYLTTPTASDDGLDGLTTENRIYNNTVRNANNGIVVSDADDNIFSNNTLENIESYEYFLSDGSEIEIEDQHFTDDEISVESGTNTVTISNSGTITVDYNDSEDVDDDNTHDTDVDFYTVELSGDETITIESIN